MTSLCPLRLRLMPGGGAAGNRYPNPPPCCEPFWPAAPASASFSHFAPPSSCLAVDDDCHSAAPRLYL